MTRWHPLDCPVDHDEYPPDTLAHDAACIRWAFQELARPWVQLLTRLLDRIARALHRIEKR